MPAVLRPREFQWRWDVEWRDMPDDRPETDIAVSRGPLAAEDAAVAGLRRRADADGVAVPTPATLALLRVLAAAVRARRVFDVGTGYGLASLSVALELPTDGLLFTVERDPARVIVARDAFERAGVAGRVNVMQGEAARLVHKVAGPFDLIVVDAGNDPPPVAGRLLALLRGGGVLVWIGPPDNVGGPLPGAFLRTAVLETGDAVTVSVKMGDQP